MKSKNFSTVNSELKETVRNKIKQLINARKSNEIIFTADSIHSINIITQGIVWRPRDLILFPENELPKYTSALQHLQNKSNCSLERVNVIKNGTLDLAHLEELLENSEGRILFFISHVNEITGILQPIKELFSLVKKYEGITVLNCNDSIVSEPINVQDQSTDFLFFDSENIGVGEGLGFLYGDYKKLEKLNPIFTKSTKSLMLPNRLELEKINSNFLTFVIESLTDILDQGVDDLKTKYLLLSATLLGELQDCDHIKILCPEYYKAGIISFYTDNMDLDKNYDFLKDFDVEFGFFDIDEYILQYSTKGVIKVKWDHNNTKDDMINLAEYLKKLK
jgi:selenocysteine lyase/cysteine desulfurase